MNSRQHLAQAIDESRAVLVRVHLGRGDEEQVVEAGLRQQARHRHAGEDAARGEVLDHIRCRARQAQRELVEERLVDDRAPFTSDKRSASFTALA